MIRLSRAALLHPVRGADDLVLQQARRVVASPSLLLRLYLEEVAQPRTLLEGWASRGGFVLQPTVEDATQPVPTLVAPLAGLAVQIAQTVSLGDRRPPGAGRLAISRGELRSALTNAGAVDGLGTIARLWTLVAHGTDGKQEVSVLDQGDGGAIWTSKRSGRDTLEFEETGTVAVWGQLAALQKASRVDPG